MTEFDKKTYIEDERIYDFAKMLGEKLIPNGKASVSKYIEEIVSSVNSVNETAEKIASGKLKMSDAAEEWFLDNRYIAEREGKEAVRALKELPKLMCVSHNEEKRPMVERCAHFLALSGNCVITEKRMYDYLDGFQEKRILSETELYAFTAVLKGKLVIILSDVCKSTDKNEWESTEKYFENIFTSLRFLSGFDASEVLERVSRTERMLRKDPAGVYTNMDEDSRRTYRNEISKLAEKEGISEYDLASELVEKAKNEGNIHIGFLIFPRNTKNIKRRKYVYIGSIVITSVVLASVLSVLLENVLAGIISLFPISEIVKNIVDYISVRIIRPKRMPRMEFTEGIPEKEKTLCVVSVLLGSSDSIRRSASLLEEYRISNRDSGKNLMFSILGDLPEAKTPIDPLDKEKIEAAKEEVNKLNEKYGGGFFFFTRKRVFSESCKCYMGRERKRGAIEDLISMLRDDKSDVVCLSGDESELKGVKYIIALDSDTRLLAGSAKELVSAAAHPLNRPCVDEKTGCVISGHGILGPRISTDLLSAGKTDFTKIFAGQGGVDPYGSLTSEVYQDLFKSGSFNGKGIINIDAYKKCLEGRFRENRILSHDLLEGSFLNCGYIGDVELTDGYPSKILSYFKRQNRWIRGDWQNINWLFGTVKNAKNEKYKNPLDPISKWKIFDNLRRSIVPVFTLILIVYGLIAGGNILYLSLVGVITYMSNMLISSAELVIKREPGTKTRYHSAIISGFAGWMMQTIIRLILLPYEAWTSLSGILTALYRMIISKKNLLSWVTAADTEKSGKNTVFSYFKSMWITFVVAIAMFVFSESVLGYASGVVWLFSPLYAYLMSREKKNKIAINTEEKEELISYAKDMWRYFDELMNEEGNFLPPDNYQEDPLNGIAYRTSPTNIGFSLLSALSSCDMKIITVDRLKKFSDRVLKTVEMLPKWNGHLYNWYDTKSLEILPPAYVSTVDSGNLYGCFVVMEEGLKEYKLYDEAKRCKAIYEKMSFKSLYDEKRKLFYIGWDVWENKPTNAWYDLLESEVRQTSYIAIAKGDVPKKHWGKLGRALVSYNKYCGMVSWTGTMFEYLMPNLILPCYENSSIYESSKFSIYVQKKMSEGEPWGKSESAFYAFDPGLNYKYKAHGIQRLALKRKMDTEKVISPYSTFLSLPLDKKGAMKNLERLKRYDLKGKYGFYEACDFTPSRVGKGGYKPVKSYMSHHIGMSITAVNNTVSDNIMQKRFMRNCEMRAFSELLEERVPVGEIVLKKVPREIPDKPQRITTDFWCEKYTGVDFESPRCGILSRPGYSVIVSENGQTHSKWNDISLTAFNGMQTGDGGIMHWIEVGGGLLPLTPWPSYDDRVSYKSEFSGKSFKISSKRGAFSASVSVSVPEENLGEIRKIELKYTGNEIIKAKIYSVFKPVMAKRDDYYAHPAFSKLSLHAEKSENTLILQRLERGNNTGCFLAVSSDKEIKVGTSQGELFGRGEILPQNLVFSESAFKPEAPDMIVCIESDILLKPGRKEKVKYSLSMAKSKDEAENMVKSILLSGRKNYSSYFDVLAIKYGMKKSTIESAMNHLSELIYVTGNRKKVSINTDKLYSKGDLWSFGISGDLPILSAKIEANEIEKAIELIKEFLFLSDNGFSFDLALLISDGGDYRMPHHWEITEFLIQMGKESVLGKNGGIHIVNSKIPNSEAVIMYSSCVCGISDNYERKTEAFPKSFPKTKSYGTAPDYKFNEKDEFVFSVDGRLPEVSWSNMLTNGHFGFISSDAGTGHSWWENARENKINRWGNDVLSTKGTEQLRVSASGKEFSLFGDEDGQKCRITYGKGYSVWEKKTPFGVFKTTAFVPPKIKAKIFIIEAAKLKSCELMYFTDIILGDKPSTIIRSSYINGIIKGENPENDQKVSVLSSNNKCEFTCSRVSWEQRNFDGFTGSGVLPCISFNTQLNDKLIIAVGFENDDVMKSLTDIRCAELLLNETKKFWNEIISPIKIKTENEALDSFINGWGLYQTIACRIMGRTSMYQSGGAYGFRDQLQDACSAGYASPEILKRQIILAASHQYEEGDVQHWWHPDVKDPSLPGKGVRTNCSDDLLWLPYALCEYVRLTGDTEILEIKTNYIESRPLEENVHDRYEQPGISSKSDTILNHALKAIECVVLRGVGDHGLLLMGGGDWNDGMNLVGAKGKGESVWLSFFFVVVCKKLSELLDFCGYGDKAMEINTLAEKIKRSADNAWDGSWYLRGYYDNGEKLGSKESTECKIDSIAQSFAIFAGGSPDKCTEALKSAEKYLFDRKNGIINLFSPPFSKCENDPGYIKGYAPGFRENGGQYTHGAIWLTMAMLEYGFEETGYEMLNTLLPYNHNMYAYKGEPFIISADVYSNAYNMGRCGWSWYTGAAGWYYRAVIESLLGIKIVGGRLYLSPNLPHNLKGYTARIKMGDRELDVTVKNENGYHIKVNGKEYDKKGYSLKNEMIGV